MVEEGYASETVSRYEVLGDTVVAGRRGWVIASVNDLIIESSSPDPEASLQIDSRMEGVERERFVVGQEPVILISRQREATLDGILHVEQAAETADLPQQYRYTSTIDLLPPNPAGADSARVWAAAHAYLDAMPVEKLMKDMAVAMVEQFPPSQRQDAAAMFDMIDIAEMEEVMLQAMTRHFTVREIEVMTAFYGSPEGQSIMEKMPAYMADFMPYVQAEVMKSIEATIRSQQSRPGIGLGQ